MHLKFIKNYKIIFIYKYIIKRTIYKMDFKNIMDFYGYINKSETINEEGLIQSVEYDIFVEKVSRLLNKLNLNYEFEKIDLTKQIVDVELILNLRDAAEQDKIHYQIFTLVNNLGYFCSYYNTNKFSKNKPIIGTPKFSSNVFYLYFNKKFDTNVDIKGINFLYHVTLNHTYETKIKKSGMTVRNSKIYENYPERIYLMDVKDNLELFAYNKLERIKKHLDDTHKAHLIKIKDIYNWAVLKIDTTKIKDFKLFKDPKFTDVNTFYTMNYIPSSAIEKLDVLNLNLDDDLE